MKTYNAASLFLLPLLLLGACASVPEDPEERIVYEENNDPIEPVNRVVFGFNEMVDTAVLRPVARGYRYVLPEYPRDRIASFLQNLGEPVNFVNNLLQGRGSDAADTMARFVMNSTVGIGGLFDVAAEMQVEERHGDFGQTLHVWGVGAGPYLVLPLLGPSNPRDGVGIVGDALMDPWNYVIDNNFNDSDADALIYGRLGLSVVDARARALDLTDQLKRDSIDYYATMRSISRQYRQHQLEGGKEQVPGTTRITPTGN